MARLFFPVLVLLVVAVPTPAQLGGRDANALVDAWFKRYLNRDRDRYSQAFVDALQSGADPNQALAGILASAEYQRNAGGTPAGLIRRLYRDLAGRAPTDRELGYWEAELYRSPPSDVAYALLTRYPQHWDDSAPPWKDQYEYRRPGWRHR